MPLHYSFPVIQSEVLDLLRRGVIRPQQPIYMLSRYVPIQEWAVVEQELEDHEFLLRDRIGDLVASKDWRED